MRAFASSIRRAKRSTTSRLRSMALRAARTIACTFATLSRAQSGGLNLQDANLLRVEVTYGYELKVPLINGLISRLLGLTRDSDAFHQQLLRRNRLPITSTAIVRMQSPLRFSELLVSRADLPRG